MGSGFSFFKTHALMLFLLFADTSLGVAQDSSPDISEYSLEQLGQITVYSASKHMQAAAEAPSSVTVITAEEIQLHGYRTLADVLKGVRGFYVSYDRNYSYVGVRGFNRPGDYNTRILLLVDGHRINDNIYDQAMVGTEFPLDIDLISRIEVIRGPSASLYGSNAFFAVINVITRKTPELSGWELSFEPGSFNTYKGRVSHGGSFKGAKVVFSGSLYDSAGQTLYFPEYNHPDTNHGIVRNADYDRYADLFLTADFHHFTLQALDGWREKWIPTGAYGTTFADPRTRSIDQHQYIDLRYRNSFASWELAARSYYDRYGYDGYWPFPQASLNVDYARGQRWGSELQLSRTLARNHHLTLGAEFRDNLQQDQKNYDVAPGFVYVDDQRTSWMGAGFVEDEYAVTHRLSLNAGLRYDHYTRYGGSGNPRVGLIYHPFPETSLKLLFGTAFRVPNVYEAYYGSSDAGLSGYILNPRLAPESMKNLEAVWEQELTPRLRISTNVFRSYINDLISLEEEPNTGELIFQNVDQARSTGIEFEANGQLQNGLKGGLSYTYVETEDRTTKQIMVDAPRHVAKLNLTAPLVKQSLLAGADAQYVDARRTLAGSQAPGFPIFNLTVLGHLGNRHLDVSASIYNLLDRRYFDVAPPGDKEDVIRQDGRNFRVKLIWRWGGQH
jgi:outer membrane receptor protein involved in Fe transport